MVFRRLILVVALGGALAALPGTALGAVAALERAGGATGSTSSNKSFNARCPAGKLVLGAGADIGGGAGQVGIVDMIPNAALTAVSARAVEDGDGFGANWSVGGSALCATPIPGLQRIVATSPTDSADKGVTAACPANRGLLGTGAAIIGGGGEVLLRELIPDSGLKSVSAFAVEDESGFAGNWSVTAYAICAIPVAGLERVVAPSDSDSNTSKIVFATCPAGKQVTGVGGKLEGSSGQVVMDDLLPFPNPATGVQLIGIEDQTGTSADWTATAYAICVNSSVLVTDPSIPDSMVADADCTAGKLPTGAGGDITGGVGEVVMSTLTASLGEPEAFVMGFEDQTGTERSWTLRAHAICATPLPGLERIESTSPINSSMSKEVVATCPAGKRVVGPGGSTEGPDGQILMDRIVPNASLTNVTVRAQEDDDLTAEAWTVSSSPLCADPPPGLQRTTAASELDSEELKVVTVSCAAGKNLLGAGAAIDSASGEVVIDDLRPNALLTSVTATAIEDEDGLAGDWRVTAYAICANP